MSTLPEHLDELIDLVESQLHDRLIEAPAARLEQILNESAESRAVYAELMMDAAALRKWAGASPTAAPIIVPHADAKPAPGEASGTGPRPIPFVIYPISIAAALLFTAAIVGVYMFAFSTDPQPDPIKPHQPGPAVATLIENTGDLRTPADFPVEGESSGAGEYTLTSGTAEFMLTNAVNVKLRGDTRMVMRNDMNVSLTHGSARFVCPENAKGFTVHLPDGSRVVDLGTAFVVRIDHAGLATVAVTEGLVELHTKPTDGSPTTTQLAAGKHARIGATRDVVVSDAIAGPDFEDIHFVHWSFDDADSDVFADTGRGFRDSPFDIEPSDDPTRPEAIDGPVGRAIAFDGIDDRLASDFKGVLGAKPRTVAMWVRVPESATEKRINATFLWWGTEQRGGSRLGEKWLIALNNNNSGAPKGALRCSIGGAWIAGSTPLNDGRWHHVAVVLRRVDSPDARDIRLYVDGAREQTHVPSEPVPINTTADVPVVFGVGPDASKKNAAVAIDEVYIFGSALDEQLIHDLARQGAGAVNPNLNPVP